MSSGVHSVQFFGAQRCTLPPEQAVSQFNGQLSAAPICELALQDMNNPNFSDCQRRSALKGGQTASPASPEIVAPGSAELNGQWPASGASPGACPGKYPLAIFEHENVPTAQPGTKHGLPGTQPIPAQGAQRGVELHEFPTHQCWASSGAQPNPCAGCTP